MKYEFEAGDIVKIPLKNKEFAYARYLVDGTFAIYELFSTNGIGVNRIIESEILFTARVNRLSMKENGWQNMCNISLNSVLQNFHPVYFNPSPTDQLNIDMYHSKKIEIENAIEKD